MGYDGFINFVTFGKIFGLKHLALFYWKKWSFCNLPFSFPIFGGISHKEELLNIRDNILQGTIRDRNIEKQLRKAKQPVIVDCGVNVGVTVRWWFYLNPQATVYGIDMMQEANDFTKRALSDRFKARYVPITTTLSSKTGHIFDVKFNDPLFGMNSIYASGKHFSNRRMFSITLDDCLCNRQIETIDLLKVDIENSAASMFRGAFKILPKVKNILLEMHSEKERKDSIGLLRSKGFCIRKSNNRHIWLEKIRDNPCPAKL